MTENEQIEFLQNRRCIRKYTSQPVSREDLETLVETAMYAPSAKSFFPWHFVIIQDEKIKEGVMQVHPHASMLKYASAAILVCGDLDIQPELGYLLMDGAACTMNILHAAHALKLGSCWLGIYPREERMQGVRELLNLPPSIVPIAMVAVGHTEVVKEKPDRINKERIHFNKF